jgi:D-beta-D-heptose 7-phosphate kinase/D-beta-D-heptose 1-phosphate adenosyltransferase
VPLRAAPLREAIQRLRGRRVLVVGDVMIDEYLRGDVSRISPEAPVPVLEVRAHEFRLGGAANAAANLAALGGAVALVGVVGADDTAAILGAQLAQREIANRTVPDLDRPTSKKTRLIAQQQQIVRIDREVRHPVAGALAEAIRRAIDDAIGGAHALVLSDYAKGVVTPEIAQHALAAARRAGIPAVVDPKQRDFALYRGATVITPNLHELEAAAPGPHPYDVARAAEALLGALDGAALLVTRSAEGMSLFRRAHPPVHVPAIAREVFDVTGAGDTVVAALALALGAEVPIDLAIELASLAAAISVSKRGTSTVTPGELEGALAQG